MQKRTLLLVTGIIFFSSKSPCDILEAGVVDAQLRYYSMQRDYDKLTKDSEGDYTLHERYKKSSNAIGGRLGLVTAPYNGITAGVTFYTSQPAFRNPPDQGGLQLLEDDQQGFTVLGEANLAWSGYGTLLKVGRQCLSEYRFLSDMDIRMVPYTYEAAIAENRSLENITFRAAAVHGVKKLISTEYTDFITASSNLLIEPKKGPDPLRGDFRPEYFDPQIGYIGPKENLYLLSFVYDDKRYTFETWNYYVPHFVNFIYAETSARVDTGGFRHRLYLQGIKQNDVGGHWAGTIDTWEFGVKYRLTYENWILIGAHTRVKYDEHSLDGGTVIDSWGNNMIYNSYYYNSADEGGTIANGVTLSYQFSAIDLTVEATFADVDIPNGPTELFVDQDNCEYDFTLTYRPDWNRRLEIKAVAIYVDFDTSYDYRLYETIHGYPFSRTYDSILDTRLIVNYAF